MLPYIKSFPENDALLPQQATKPDISEFQPLQFSKMMPQMMPRLRGGYTL